MIYQLAVLEQMCNVATFSVWTSEVIAFQSRPPQLAVPSRHVCREIFLPV